MAINYDRLLNAKPIDQKPIDYDRLIAAQPIPEPGLGEKALNTVQALGTGLSNLPTYAKGYVANLAEGSHPLDENNTFDQWAQESNQLGQQQQSRPDVNDPTLFGTKGEWDQTMQSMPFSVGSMGGALVGGLAGDLVGGGANPVTSYAGAAAASGALAHRADSAMFMRNALEGYANKYRQDNNGAEPSQQELLAEQERLQPYATEHGLWEAIPEAIGTPIGAKMIGSVFKPGGNVLYKGLKAAAGIAAEEIPTEVVTQHGQTNTEIDAGVQGGEKRSFLNPEDYAKSFNEVAVPVIQQSALMGGGSVVAKKAYNYATGPLSKAAATVQPPQGNNGIPNTEQPTEPPGPTGSTGAIDTGAFGSAGPAGAPISGAGAASNGIPGTTEGRPQITPTDNVGQLTPQETINGEQKANENANAGNAGQEQKETLLNNSAPVNTGAFLQNSVTHEKETTQAEDQTTGSGAGLSLAGNAGRQEGGYDNGTGGIPSGLPEQDQSAENNGLPDTGSHLPELKQNAEESNTTSTKTEQTPQGAGQATPGTAANSEQARAPIIEPMAQGEVNVQSETNSNGNQSVTPVPELADQQLPIPADSNQPITQENGAADVKGQETGNDNPVPEIPLSDKGLADVVVNKRTKQPFKTKELAQAALNSKTAYPEATQETHTVKPAPNNQPGFVLAPKENTEKLEKASVPVKDNAPNNAAVNTENITVKQPSVKDNQKPAPKNSKDSFVSAYISLETKKRVKVGRSVTNAEKNRIATEAGNEYDNWIVNALNSGKKLSNKAEIPDHGLTLDEYLKDYPAHEIAQGKEQYKELIDNAKKAGLVVRNNIESQSTSEEQTHASKKQSTNAPNGGRRAQSEIQQESGNKPGPSGGIRSGQQGQKSVQQVAGESQQEKPVKSNKDNLTGKQFDKHDVPYELAVRVYSGISFDPDKRANQEQEGYVEHMQHVYDEVIKHAKNDDQKSIIDDAFNTYKEGYLKRLLAHLSAKSRVLSPMITGPANFPVRRNEKANNVEHKRLTDLLDYDKYAQEKLNKIALGTRSEKEKTDERISQINKRLESSLSTIKAIDEGTERGYSRALFVSSITGTIKTLAKNNETGLVNQALDFIQNYQKDLKKPLIAPKNSIWNLRDKSIPENSEVKKNSGVETLRTYNGARIVNNHDLERVQVLFDEKPDANTRDALKKEAFKWSPTNNAWQRQNTQNGINSAIRVLNGLYEKTDNNFSKTSIPGKSTKAELISVLPTRVKPMIKAGKLQVVQSINEAPPEDLSSSESRTGVQAYYNRKSDKIFLIADNISKKDLNSVLYHELLHRAEFVDKRLQSSINRFENDLERRFNLAVRGIGSPVELAAYKRVINSNTPLDQQQEEFRAYLVSEYLKNPTGFIGKLKRIFDDFIASLRVALVHAGIDFNLVRSLSPADLFAMSKYGSRVDLSTNNKEMPLFSKQQRLAPNGKPSNLNAMQWEQVRTPEFIKWFGDWINDPENASKVVDDNGEPLVVFHGSDADFSKFDINMLGNKTNAQSAKKGFFFTNNSETAHTYSFIGGGGAISKYSDLMGDIEKNQQIINEQKVNLKKYGFGSPDADRAKHANALKEKEVAKKNIELILDKSLSRFRKEMDEKIAEINAKEDVAFEKSGIKSYEKFLTTKEGRHFSLLKQGAELEKTNGPSKPGSVIYSLFLNIRNPYIKDFNGSSYRDETYDAVLRKAITNNNDGVILKNTFDNAKIFLGAAADIYVVFNPNKTKSAIGNTGGFNKENNDIRYSIASDITDWATGRDRNIGNLRDLDIVRETGHMPHDNINMQQVLDKAATMLVDSSRPFDAWARKLPNTMTSGQMILAKDRSKRRTAAMEKEAMDNFLHPLAKVLGKIAKDTGMDYRATSNLVGHWMSQRYAIEKNYDYIRQDQQAVDDAEQALSELPDNAELKAAVTKAKNKQEKRLKAINEARYIDPTEESLAIGLAGGYNNFTAKEEIRKTEAVIPVEQLKKAAQPVYDMMAWKVKRDLQNGKVTQDQVDKWFDSPYYVPLTGDPSMDASEDELFNTGALNQQSDKRAVGRAGSIAQSGIDAATEQVSKSARYHGWVDFKDKFTEIYDNLIQAEMDNGATQREAQIAVQDKYGIRRMPETPMVSPSTIIIRKNGKNWAYDIGDKAAMDALRSVNHEDTPSALRAVAFFTRSYARMVTLMMPGFGPVNAIRDTWERSENIRSRMLPGYENVDMNKVARAALLTAADPRLVRKLMVVMFDDTILKDKFNVNENDPDIKLMREMIAEGGTGTVGDYISKTNADLSKQMLDKLSGFTKANDVMMAWNNSFELVSSFSIYKSLRNAGVDKKTAASGTLNMMNFGKKGTITGPLKALYVFVNPTMQGGHQLIQTLSTERGRARAVAYTLSGMMLYAMLRVGDDDDETGANRLDELGNFMLERNIPVRINGTEIARLPVGFGLPQMAWSTAVNLDKMLDGRQEPGDTTAEILKSWSRTLAPVAPSETSIARHPFIWIAQTFTPQIAKPMVNVALDVNTFGAPLTNARFEREDKAKSLQGRKTTPEFFRMVAKELATFGIDTYPENIQELLRGYAVGPLNEAIKAFVVNPHKESLGRKAISPLFDRFIMAQDDQSMRDRLYYRYRDEMNDAAVKASLGKPLTPRESTLAKLNESIKRLENRANGKMAAATKAEKGRNVISIYRKQAEQMRDNAQKIVFSVYKRLE